MINRLWNLITQGASIWNLAIRVIILCVAGSLLGLCANILHPHGLNPFRPTPAMVKLDEYTYIDFDTAKEKYNMGDAIFIDARTEEEFNAGHIPGALNLSFEDFSEGKPEILEFLPEDIELLIYCDTDECKSSEQVARLLKSYNYTNVKIVQSGWVNWQTHQREIEQARER